MDGWMDLYLHENSSIQPVLPGAHANLSEHVFKERTRPTEQLFGKRGWREERDGGTDVTAEVAPGGGEGERGVTEAGKGREEHLRESPTVLGKHRAGLYP